MPQVNGRYVPDMKSPRTPANEEDPKERAKDFRPVDKGYTKEMAIKEANRCLDCKKPFCIDGCPVGIDIPKFIEAIRNEDFGRGLDIIHEQSMLPAICGRVCPQENQCEGKCIRSKKGEPVAIGQLERFLGDMPEVASAPKVAPKNGKKVAVVGAGPSGITCAGELARNGFDVTVFEAFFTGGGVLAYGIPEFRLPKAVVKREIDGLEQLGVKFEYNSVVGRITTAEELFDEGYDAMYIATGAGLPKMLNIPGENLPNVFFANEYLTRVNLMKANEFPKYDTPTKHAKDVVVFGGGNVAMDSVRTALRLGAENVMLCYRRTEKEMPARRAEIEHAKAEGVQIHELASPIEFIAGENGSVAQVKVQNMRLGEPDESGRRRPIPIEGSVDVLPCDLGISAIGTNANPISKLIGPEKINKWGYIEADEKTGQTSDPRIWAGGDIVTGAATVILAMGAGKAAAADMTKKLVATA
ncbi:MAG: NADPH-dependent glutamate synthase [Coriobacteriaceae bacterium]|uniref:NADPH-dependent glutamate synthase n=1 Tax=Atopobium sp. oral taxon 416 TaxID=712157 RepID=UPI000FF25401|nr:NADPH-dependent glutamate synthase [Atopobium sp. oral taxon 416]QUC03829.1 NADPH-dependent glutamate synthase [Atopobium sp. oral taxon 416]RRF98186.1 MAG: NADPH-dependent glutamate synthase [Coriobacteriaceae bacterium]